MTNDVDKLIAFERILQVIKDEIALERYTHEQGLGYEMIEFHRANAYEGILRIISSAGGSFSDRE